jgi:hypothetical protein
MYALIKDGVVINIIEIDPSTGDRQKAAQASYKKAMKAYEAEVVKWAEALAIARQTAKEETEEVRAKTGNKKAFVPVELKMRQPTPPEEPSEMYVGPFVPPEGCELVDAEGASIGARYENGKFTAPKD